MSHTTQKLKRVVLVPNEIYQMQFDVSGSHFLVKNFGNGEDDSPCVYVSLGETITDDNSAFKILSNCYQEIFINDANRIDNRTNLVYLKSTGAIEIEVQITRW